MGWETVLIVGLAAGGTAYMAESQRKAASKARSARKKELAAATAAEKKRQQFMELEAGEYAELTEKQMAIQAMRSQTRSLAELIDRQRPPPSQQRIYTLPTAERTDPIQRVNKAIDDILRGRHG